MKFKNLTRNTVYLQDIDKDILFEEIQEIDVDDAKKSSSFRKMLQLGHFQIEECGNSLFEKNLLRLQGPPCNIQNSETIMETIEPGQDIEVRIKGHFFDAGGYAKVNRNLALGLARLGAKVQIESSCNFINNLNELEVKQLAPFKRQLSQKAICIDSMIPTFGSQGFGKYKILYTTVEAYSVPKQVIDILNSYNEIWVTSDFCKEILGKYTKRDIFVLPDSINTSLYKEECEPHEFRPSLKDFVFISVFGWNYRKGYDVLLRSYLEEFSGNEPVSLLIFSRYQSSQDKNMVIKKTIDDYIKRYGGETPAHIARCSQVIPEFQMPGIYKACDAFVLFSRGEGFMIPACEASLCGLPVIATNVSGQTMFLNHDNSTLIEPDKFGVCPQGSFHVHYWENETFPLLSDLSVIENARKAMRDVYTNHGKAVNKNRKLQSFIKENYNISRISLLAKNRLEQIWRKS